MNTAHNLLDGFPSIVTFPIAWGQMDAFGHLNNTAYFRFFETGRIDCFTLIGVLDHMQTHGQGPILAHTECRFRLPLTWPDTVDIGTRITDVREDQFTQSYRVVSRAHGALAAEGTGRIVWFDYKAQNKAPLPDTIKAAIDAL